MRIPHGNEGTVSEISYVIRKSLTVDNKTVVLPNGSLSNSSLTNLTQQNKRDVSILPSAFLYDADIRLTKQVISDVLEQGKKTCMTNEEPYYVFCRQSR